MAIPPVSLVHRTVPALLAAALIGAVAVGLVPSAARAAAAGCGDSWTSRASGVAADLYGVAWTGTRLVAVGDNGTVLTSPDGVTWTPQASGVSARLYGVAWTGTQLVAVGESGTIVTSPDGAVWAAQGSGTSAWLYAVCWTGAQLVAVGDTGAVVTSPDGVAWTPRSSGFAGALAGVAGTTAQVVAAGNPSTVMTILSSPDGVTWTQHLVASSGGWFAGLASSGSQFVAVGVVGAAYTSPDGLAWTPRASGVSQDFYAVLWTGSQFVAAGEGGAIATSPDGVIWTPRSSGTAAVLRGVAATGSQLVAVGAAGTIVTNACSASSYPYAVWLPVVSHNPGLYGSEFRSDLGLLNNAMVPANVELELFIGARPITSTTYVPPGSQSILQDIVAELGTSGSGALEVLSDQPLRVTSRTYTQTMSGTYGQDYISYTVDQGLTAGQSAVLPQLTENAAYRTNIGLTNTGPTPAQITVELHDGAGAVVGAYGVSLDPGEFRQATQPFKNVAHVGALQRGWARVSVTAGSGVLSYASVLDNATNDPTTIIMQR